jgi:hypothetical protein
MPRISMILLPLLAALAGCGSIFTPEPTGIGSDRDALKQSPCACGEIPQDYSPWTPAG